jgi:sulfide dehydrogenase cytochrome subunit
MSHRVRLAAAALGIALAAVGASHAAGPTRADLLVGSCFGCHGSDGHSPGAIPSLAGKSPDFIEQALRGFRTGTRPGTVMSRHATGYSDEEIRLIAQFFSTH